MSTEATPTAVPSGIPPVPPVADPSNVKQDETVVLKKEEAEQLRRDAARASEAQSRADRYESILKKNGLLGGHFKTTTPAAQPTPEERQAAGAEEDRRAEQGLIALAIDPTYREILDKDPTLRDMLIKNPLAILPVLAPDALDADDAISLVKEALNKRKPTATFPAAPLATPVTPPPPGAINAQDKPVNEAVEAARKNPNTERAVAGMIGARLRENAGKK